MKSPKGSHKDFRHKLVTCRSQGDGLRGAIATIDDQPISGGQTGWVEGTPDGQVGFLVAIIILGNSYIARHAPLNTPHGATGAVDDRPLADRWTPDCHVGCAISVVILGNWNVARHTPLPGVARTVGAINDPPHTGRRAPHRK